jgi:hypothetical protein
MFVHDAPPAVKFAQTHGQAEFESSRLPSVLLWSEIPGRVLLAESLLDARGSR